MPELTQLAFKSTGYLFMRRTVSNKEKETSIYGFSPQRQSPILIPISKKAIFTLKFVSRKGLFNLLSAHKDVNANIPEIETKFQKQHQYCEPHDLPQITCPKMVRQFDTNCYDLNV